MQETDELKVLFPGKELTIQGETIVIKPFKFGKLPAVLKVLQNIASVVQVHMQNKTIETPEALIEIASKGGEDLYKLMALCIGKDVAWFDEIESDEGIELLLAFIEVNFSFFIERILPMLNGKLSNMTQDSKAQLGLK